MWKLMGMFPLDQDLLDGVKVEMMFHFIEYGFKIQPNGTLFIRFYKSSLCMTMMANKFLHVGDIKYDMNLGVAR